MTKECKVLLNNDDVTVVRYDSTKIQFPATHKQADTVWVECKDGKYQIVAKPDNSVAKVKDAEVIKTKKKNVIEKKTTTDTTRVHRDTAAE